MSNLILKPPEIVRGLKQLNKQLFQKQITVQYLEVKNNKLSNIVPLVKSFLLKLEKFKPIETLQNDGTNVYLNPEMVSAWHSLPESVIKSLNAESITENNLKSKQFTLNYDHFSIEDIFRSVLPTDEMEGMSSFTKIGHIVHINMREHLIPYKSLIGDVLLEKVHNCRTVVNKTNAIESTYRNFQMEILAGEDDMMTTLKENTCSFTFDFSKVYWNSRLSTEHERIVKMLEKNDVLFDVFAGVGPFSVPAAKKRCTVFANDLNPESFKYLNENSRKNKVPHDCFQSYNLDGREFIERIVKVNLIKYFKEKKRIFIVMNLPALATDFLNAFTGLLNQNDLDFMEIEPIVYVYCFTKGENYTELARELVNKSFGFDVNRNIVEIFRVRTVSSLKEMMRVCLRLDKEILGGNLKRKCETDERITKKCKLILFV